MPSPNWTRFVVGLLALGVFVISTVTGQSIDRDGYKWLAGIASAIVLLFIVYDRWAWRWPGFRFLSERTGVPVLRGTWKGTLTYESDAEGKPGSAVFFMAIHQTYTEIELHGYVSGSESHSMAARFERPSRGQRLLWFIYRSEAGVLQQDGNRPHHGGTKLSLVGSPVQAIRGSYWTDRLGRGELEFSEYSKTVYDSFSTASSGEYAGRS